MSYTDRSAHANKAKTYIGNIEILARTRPGKMARMVTLIYIYIYIRVNCIQTQ